MVLAANPRLETVHLSFRLSSVMEIVRFVGPIVQSRLIDHTLSLQVPLEIASSGRSYVMVLTWNIMVNNHTLKPVNGSYYFSQTKSEWERCNVLTHHWEPCELKTPTQLNSYSQQCMRKTFSASFVPQPAENHTSSWHKNGKESALSPQQESNLWPSIKYYFSK